MLGSPRKNSGYTPSYRAFSFYVISHVTMNNEIISARAHFELVYKKQWYSMQL